MISDELRLEDGASPSQMKSPPLFRLNLAYNAFAFYATFNPLYFRVRYRWPSP